MNQTIPVQCPGDLTDRLPGWAFKPSAPRNGQTFNEFEGYYPDKGGKLSSMEIVLDKAPDECAFYRIRFDAEAPVRAYQGVDYFDAAGNLLPDCYDVIYPGPRRSYDRVVYAMAKVHSIRVFFQSSTGLRAWNLSVERTDAATAAAYCDRVYAELPKLDFTAPAGSFDGLPRTREALRSGKPWKVLMLGDSIIQDTYHSQFHALVKRAFPQSDLRFAVSVRGSTGCWYYVACDQFKKYVLDEKPDLLIIGGISNIRAGYNPTGAEAMAAVGVTARELLGCEVLVLSAALAVDTRPWDEEHPEAALPAMPWSWSNDQHSKNGCDRVKFPEVFAAAGIPYWDLQQPTYRWLYGSRLPHEWYSRDYVHSGELGKQIIGRALFEYFRTAKV